MLDQIDQVVTVVVDPYFVTTSQKGLGRPYGEAGELEYTGVLQHPYPGDLFKLRLPEGRWIIFNSEDAWLKVNGPSDA